jgi:hypothetical protein
VLVFIFLLFIFVCVIFKKKEIASVGLRALSNNAIFGKVLARKVLGFKSVLMTPSLS